MLETPGGTGLYISFNVTTWLMVIVIITLGLVKIGHTKNLVIYPIFLWLLLGLLFIVLPFSFNAPFQDHMILKVLGVLGGLLLFIACSQFSELRSNPKQLLWLMLIAAVIQISTSLAQILMPDVFIQPWFDANIHRPYGLFLQPNIMATFLATVVAICLFLMSDDKLSNKQVLFLSLLIAVSSFILPHLQSLSGNVSFILAIVLTMPRLITQRRRLALFQLAIILSVYTMSSAYSSNEQAAVKLNDDYNVSVRKDIYINSLKMISDKPLMGYGYGSFERAYLDYHNALRRNDSSVNPPLLKLDHPHNEILLWGVEGGIIALLGIGCFIFGFFSVLKAPSAAQLLALLGLVAPISFHALVELPFDNSASHWHILILLVFVIMALGKNSFNVIKLPSALLPYTGATLTAGVFIPFLLTTIHTTTIVMYHENNNFQHIEHFKKIVNPLPLRERILANVNAQKFLQGLQDKNPALLEQYVDWAIIQVQFKPRIQIYQDLLLCLKILNREQDYNRYLAEAKLTYPEQETWSRLADKGQ